MGLTFANLLGFWALAGVPIVLAIHFFHRRPRALRVATLFLLEASSPLGDSGRTFQRLRASASLWLQIAAVLLATWLLVQPRWLREDSVQKTVIVLDSSLSMDAFRPAAAEALEALVRRSSHVARHREWTLLSSDARDGTLYSGVDAEGMLRLVRSWRPHLGAHDPRPVLRLARGVAGTAGRVVFLTDHEESTDEGIELLAVGSPIENMGFAGLQIEDEGGKPTWRVVVKNHGREPATRAWQIRVGGSSRPGGSVRLDAGASQVLSGEFPAGATSFALALDPDAFAVDDVMPIVLPSPKRLTVCIDPDAARREFVPRFVSTLEAADTLEPAATARADLSIASQGPGVLGPLAGKTDAIVLLDAPRSGSGFLPGSILAENDSLMQDLSWQGLLVGGGAAIQASPDDHVLLWQGTRPLVFLRDMSQGSVRSGSENSIRSSSERSLSRGNEGSQLVINFSLEESNASRLPSLVLLLHRFVESIRHRKVATERANVEIGQLLDLAVDPDGPPVTLKSGEDSAAASHPASRAQLLRAPFRPGFFEVRQGGTLLLEGAAHFADVREADFKGAVSRAPSSRDDSAVRVRNSSPDPLVPLWTVVLVGILVADWSIRGRGPQQPGQAPTAR